MGLRTAIVAVAALGVLFTGCGGDEGSATTATTGPTETADRAKLPSGWVRHTNFDAGISLGIPPLWSARKDGSATTVRSPRKLLAITVTADRTSSATEIELDEFISAVAGALTGYEDLSTGEPEPFGHRYPALAIEGDGKAADGPAQDLLLVVLSREGLVKVTALTSWNRAKTRPREIRDARRILRTIRTRPFA